MKEALSEAGVKFLYMDIADSMLALKNFLKIRDNNESHKEIKADGDVGIPVLQIDEETFYIDNADIARDFIKKYELDKN